MFRSRINSSNQDARVIIEFDDTTRAWNDWKHGTTLYKPAVQNRYVVSLAECTETYMLHQQPFIDRSIPLQPTEIPSLVDTRPEISQICYLCHKYPGQLYSCRVCGNMYHQQCIKDQGGMRSYHLMRNASSTIGWSCPICEDLRVLLPAEELGETNEWIKSLSTQTILNLDRYIISRLESKSTSHIRDHLQTFLQTIADLSANRLSTTDLLLLDVSLKVLRIPPTLLVNALSPLELYRLSQLFISLSSNDIQHVTHQKAERVLSNYLTIIVPEFDSDEKQSHVTALEYSMFGNAIETDRTWSQFVLELTLPTLLSRYNHRTPEDFIRRLISIDHSTEPSTAKMTISAGRQSLGTFMNTILQRLTQTIGSENKSIKEQSKSKTRKAKNPVHARL